MVAAVEDELDAEAADLEMRQHMRISKNDTREAARNAGMDAQF